MRVWKRLIQGGCLLAFAGILCLEAVSSGDPGDGGEESLRTGGNGSVCVLRMTYPVDSNRSQIGDLDRIADAVNEIAAEKIGAVVELIPVDMTEAQDSYMLWLARGDTIDLMLVRDQDISSYIDRGFLQPLNSYLKWNGEDIASAEEELGGMLTKGARQQGRTYGIANLTGQEAEGYGLWISEAVLEEAGISYDENHIYTFGEIDRILGSLKRIYPDSYPLGQITARQRSSTAKYFIPCGDSLESSLITGVVQGENDTVINLFAIEEYEDFLTYMRRWFEAEYAFPDAVTYDASVLPLLEEGRILMYPASSYPGTMDRLLGHETDYVCLKMTDTVQRTDYSENGYWTVPVTGNYPEEAMEFLNLMYSDPEIISLLNYGIEGEHYEFSDSGERMWIQTDEGEQESGFYNPAAQIGDLRKIQPFGTEDVLQAAAEYNAGAAEADSRYDGFVFATSRISQQSEAVRNVVRNYAPVLESGSVDLSDAYPEFLQSLSEAGIDSIIEEKQTQLDEWLEN